MVLFPQPYTESTELSMNMLHLRGGVGATVALYPIGATKDTIMFKSRK